MLLAERRKEGEKTVGPGASEPSLDPAFSSPGVDGLMHQHGLSCLAQPWGRALWGRAQPRPGATGKACSLWEV